VPNVVGDGNNTFEQAQSLLQNAGFTNVTEKCLVAKPDSPRLDHVIASSPSAGKSASRDAKIVVTVGRATC
jgi:beta-lactam-binding protein with PASTA domain